MAHGQGSHRRHNNDFSVVPCTLRVMTAGLFDRDAICTVVWMGTE